jgi:hypothetical protein
MEPMSDPYVSWCMTDSLTFDEITGDADCMTLAVKNRCRNSVERRNRRRNFDRRCEINFIPLVTVDSSSTTNATDSGRSSRRHHQGRGREDDDGGTGRQSHPHRHRHDERQLLTCRTDVHGFLSTCPSLRPLNLTDGLVWCNPLRENSKRCETTREALHRHRSPSSSSSSAEHTASSMPSAACRVFEICDHAIIVSGGWNRWTHRQLHADNVAKFYAMLRDHGFRSGNIKVFFANGAPDIMTCKYTLRYAS